jgi:hypothetical protein
VKLALGTTASFCHKLETLSLSLPEELEIIQVADVFKSSFYEALDFLRRLCQFAGFRFLLLRTKHAEKC